MFHYFTDPMIVNFDTMVFSGSESSGNITVSMELIRHSSIMSGDITVIVIPSDQSPISAEGKTCEYIMTTEFAYVTYQVMEWTMLLLLSLPHSLLESTALQLMYQ